jgi:hypothetical protein
VAKACLDGADGSKFDAAHDRAARSSLLHMKVDTIVSCLTGVGAVLKRHLELRAKYWMSRCCRCNRAAT